LIHMNAFYNDYIAATRYMFQAIYAPFPAATSCPVCDEHCCAMYRFSIAIRQTRPSDFRIINIDINICSIELK